MSRATMSSVIKPKANAPIEKARTACGVGQCDKSYVKKMALENHRISIDGEEQVTKEAEVEVIEDDTEEDIDGETQALLNQIELERIDEALEAEPEVFDNLHEALSTDIPVYSMVSHMVVGDADVTNKGDYSSNIIDILFDAVHKEVTRKEKEAEKEKSIVQPSPKPDCDECLKYKEVEEDQARAIKKLDKFNKSLHLKVKAMTGQTRFHIKKSNDQEKEVTKSRKINAEMVTKISVLELEKATLEALRNMNIGAHTPAAGAPVETVSTVTSAVGESEILSNTQGKYKCKHCEEEHQSMKRLADHIKAMHPTIQFKCGKCPKAYPFKSALKNHVKIGHPMSVHQCSICKAISNLSK